VTIEADVRLRWLEKLAKEFPDGTPQLDVTLHWENEHSHAGVTASPADVFVYLNSGQQSVESFEEAASILRQIFADEVVCVTAFADGQSVYVGLAPAAGPSAAFGRLDGRGATPDMPQIDTVMIETWSSGLVED
jgi:hypothetical protein